MTTEPTRREQVTQVFEESFEDTGYPTDAIDRIMAIFTDDAQEPDQADRAQIASRFVVGRDGNQFLVWDAWTGEPATDDRFTDEGAAEALRGALVATELERAGL